MPAKTDSLTHSKMPGPRLIGVRPQRIHRKSRLSLYRNDSANSAVRGQPVLPRSFECFGWCRWPAGRSPVSSVPTPSAGPRRPRTSRHPC